MASLISEKPKRFEIMVSSQVRRGVRVGRSQVGDTLFLKTHTGMYVDVQGLMQGQAPRWLCKTAEKTSNTLFF